MIITTKDKGLIRLLCELDVIIDEFHIHSVLLHTPAHPTGIFESKARNVKLFKLGTNSIVVISEKSNNYLYTLYEHWDYDIESKALDELIETNALIRMLL